MTRQFDVIRTPLSPGSTDAPFICVIQSHFFEAVTTVLVAPMIRATVARTNSQAAVPIRFEDENYLIDLALMANIQKRSLDQTLGSLLAYEDDIRRALDRLFTGF